MWRSPPTLNPTSLGAQGERRAARYVRQLGYIILHRNWRCAIGEIDLIAQDGSDLVFIEVKSRSDYHERRYAGLDAIDPLKQHRLRRSAEIYCAMNPEGIRRRGIHRHRFDVVTATKRCRHLWATWTIKHWTNAFR